MNVLLIFVSLLGNLDLLEVNLDNRHIGRSLALRGSRTRSLFLRRRRSSGLSLGLLVRSSNHFNISRRRSWLGFLDFGNRNLLYVAAVVSGLVLFARSGDNFNIVLPYSL